MNTIIFFLGIKTEFLFYFTIVFLHVTVLYHTKPKNSQAFYFSFDESLKEKKSYKISTIKFYEIIKKKDEN